MMTLRNGSAEVLDAEFREGERDDLLVVLCHGLTGNKDRPMIQHLLGCMEAAGYPCVSFSYNGHGKSEGSFENFTIHKAVEDVSAVLDQLKGDRKVAFIGHSISGAVGALVAAKDDRVSVMVSLAGMVHTRLFTEQEFGELTPDVGCMWDEPEFPLTSAFVKAMNEVDSTLVPARDVRAPWLLLHGVEDDVVLPRDSRDMFLNLRGKKVHKEIEGADHSFAGHEDLISEEILAWLAMYLK